MEYFGQDEGVGVGDGAEHLTQLAAGLPASVPFTGPETLERRAGVAFRARLGANESGFGPSPRAVAAMEAAAGGAWMYGDPDVHALRAAIAAAHGVDVRHVAVGEGIDGLLGLLVRLVVARGAPVVAGRGAYPTFAYHVTGFGGVMAPVAYDCWGMDPDRLLHGVAATGARLVYLSNPDNPTGAFLPADAVQRLVAGLPSGVLLVLDEAYAEFAPAGGLPGIDPVDPRVIRFRTMSKAQGLAGIRVGHAIGPAGLIAAFDRVRNHFGLGRIAQAGALAALSDPVHVAGVVAAVALARARIAGLAREAGLVPLPSATNFVAVDCGSAVLAGRLMEALLAAGIFVRRPGVAPLDRLVRISAGPPAAMEALAAVWPGAVAAARAGL